MTKPQNIKAVRGNAFAMLFPLIARTYTQNGMPSDEDIDLTHLSNVIVKVGGVEYESSIETGGVQIIIPGTLADGTYNIELTADYDGSDIRASYFEALTIVSHSYQSDAEQYIQGSPVALAPAYVIGGALTDAELEQLKQQFRQAIADAEAAEAAAQAAKEAYDEKAEQLDNVARQTTLTQGISDIRGDISHIDIDTTTLAKEVQVKDGNDTAISVGKEVRSELGTGSDTAAETGTLFAVVKWVKDKVKSIFNYIGTPASGQPNTLFGAIGDVALSAQTLQSLADSWAAMVTNRNSINNIVFEDGFTVQSSLDILVSEGHIVEIYDDTWEGEVTSPTDTFMFTGCTRLRKFVLKKVTALNGGRYQLGKSEPIVWVELPKLQAISSANYSGLLGTVQVAKFDEYIGNTNYLIHQGQGDGANIIILRIGAKWTTSQTLATWVPTYFMSENTHNPMNDSYQTNGERLNASLRENIAGILQEGGGALTLTFSQVVRDAMTTETEQAFAAKGWNIAPAKSI